MGPGMSAIEFVRRLQNLGAGEFDVHKIREEIHDEHDRATTEDERVVLLAAFKAVMDQTERMLAAEYPDRLDAFRKLRLEDYCLLVAKECVENDQASPEKMLAVTAREVAAGRMAPDAEMRRLALQGPQRLNEKGWRRAGDHCPVCAKPLRHVELRSFATLWRTLPYLMCEGYPSCNYRERTT